MAEGLQAGKAVYQKKVWRVRNKFAQPTLPKGVCRAVRREASARKGRLPFSQQHAARRFARIGGPPPSDFRRLTQGAVCLGG